MPTAEPMRGWLSLAGPIALAGLVAAGWVLFRRSDGSVRAGAREEA